MPAYMICYDNQHDGDAVGEQLREWKCVRPFGSLWFGNLNSDALTIREILRALIGDGEGLFICEVKPSSDWAGLKMHYTVSDWVRANIGP